MEQPPVPVTTQRARSAAGSLLGDIRGAKMFVLDPPPLAALVEQIRRPRVFADNALLRQLWRIGSALLLPVVATLYFYAWANSNLLIAIVVDTATWWLFIR